MSERYLIVNTEREEYLDPAAFGEHETFLGWGGFAGNSNGAMMAVAMLLMQPAPMHNSTLVGSWRGTPLVFASDGGPACEEIPARTRARLVELGDCTRNRNLHSAAALLYRHISVDCIRILCTDPYTLKALIARQCPEALRIAREER